MTMVDASVSSVSGGSVLDPSDQFVPRHIGPNDDEIAQMLERVGCASLDELVDQVVPTSIRMQGELKLGKPRGEHELISELHEMAKKNTVNRSYIGMGYHGTITPPVILRNVLENPGWYTQYTPYQAEIAQGRLQALLNFQTMIADLTGMEISGASLLDEGTASAEAMAMCVNIAKGNRTKFIVDEGCHPQTIEVIKTRARSMGINIDVAKATDAEIGDDIAGVLVQLPTTDGRIDCYRSLTQRAHEAGALVVCDVDLMAMALITPPGEWGADIVVGSAQRFGVPMGFGGPHAAFLATSVKHIRKMPGRIVGVSKDSTGSPALRLTIQTREQHIKRDRATSNICTAQALLAIISAMYGSYHGPEGIRQIASRIRSMTVVLAEGLIDLGCDVGQDDPELLFFDTLRIKPADTASEVIGRAHKLGINLRDFGDGSIGVSLDETVTRDDVTDILRAFGGSEDTDVDELLARSAMKDLPGVFMRTSEFMTHEVFTTHHSETEMLRYLKELENRDLSLAHSMIPLGSCTMKLNATSEMLPVTWPEFGALHPFAPAEQTRGYSELFSTLESWLGEITGFAGVSLQPNAGAQGEYAGLMVIRAFHDSRGEPHRNICLVPTSAHGTNPATAVMAGMKVVPVKSTERGDIDLDHLREQAETHKDNLGALMVTYPSTHGVFEEGISEVCEIVHASGGQVYMDGANMNAQVGLCRPGDIGADVCHLNLHKTFCIPHGGGGPGMGPIGVAEHLLPFIPGHPVIKPETAGDQAIGPVSAAPYGSASILPISWVYIALMGAAGLKKATQVAILNANYMVARLEDHYDIVYTGAGGRVAHEFILDCRDFDKSAGIKIDDIAKRLIDYGFHAPTMSWPVAGTLMVEPTESESLAELDRFCDAMIAIRAEIAEIERGEADRENNVLTGAPHALGMVTSDTWDRPYSRERAAWPMPWLRERKFWPAVGRVDNPFGDRNIMCSCPSVEELAGFEAG
ncbi:MAG: glycine dehydrogenase (aminomethyl-transferring) [Phycisphaera sp.]|nr:MAG: glycine dehydrogenase (aminomethyl-transferring) [Phycisphaera sp.]